MLINVQIRRISLCEKLLPVMELAGYLNDTNAALQAVAHCYGLLAPALHFKIASVPVLHVGYINDFCSSARNKDDFC